MIAALSIPLVSGAQAIQGSGSSGCPPAGSEGIPNPLKGGCDLYALIKLIINEVVLPIGAVLAVFFVIYSGFLMVTAGGNEERLKKAKTTFLYTLIGTAILLGAWVIAEGIERTIKQISKPAYNIMIDRESIAKK